MSLLLRWYIIAHMGARVLIFGDSMSHLGEDADPTIAAASASNTTGMPGAVLAALLLQRGADAVQVDAKIGRSAYNFWQREPAAQLLGQDIAFMPSIVIVFLGTNDLGLDMGVDGQAMAAIRDQLARSGAEIWVVGPPSFGDATMQAQTDAVVAMEKQVFGSSRFIDLRPLTSDILTTAQGRASDGVHFGDTTGGPIVAARLADAFTKAYNKRTVLTTLAWLAGAPFGFLAER